MSCRFPSAQVTSDFDGRSGVQTFFRPSAQSDAHPDLVLLGPDASVAKFLRIQMGLCISSDAPLLDTCGQRNRSRSHGTHNSPFDYLNRLCALHVNSDRPADLFQYVDRDFGIAPRVQKLISGIKNNGGDDCCTESLHGRVVPFGCTWRSNMLHRIGKSAVNRTT
jgi:hypothetical protein